MIGVGSRVSLGDGWATIGTVVGRSEYSESVGPDTIWWVEWDKDARHSAGKTMQTCERDLIELTEEKNMKAGDRVHYYGRPHIRGTLTERVTGIGRTPGWAVKWDVLAGSFYSGLTSTHHENALVPLVAPVDEEWVTYDSLEAADLQTGDMIEVEYDKLGIRLHMPPVEYLGKTPLGALSVKSTKYRAAVPFSSNTVIHSVKVKRQDTRAADEIVIGDELVGGLTYVWTVQHRIVMETGQIVLVCTRPGSDEVNTPVFSPNDRLKRTTTGRWSMVA